MKKIVPCLLFASLVVASAASAIQSKNGLLVRVVLFKSEPVESMHEQIDVLNSASHPEIASLRNTISGSLNAFASAAGELLINLYSLDTIDTLFFYEKPWTGIRSIQWDDLIGGEKAFYKIELYPKLLSDRQISLQLMISSGKTRIAADTLFHQEVVLNMNDPVILTAIHNGQAFYAAVVIQDAISKGKEAETQKFSKFKIVQAPPAIHLTRPSYPKTLRQRGVGGVIRFLVQIDKTGKVLAVGLDQSAHPYLDYSAVQALLRSTFEPVLLNGKPSPVEFALSYRFQPLNYKPDILSTSPWPETSPYPLDLVAQVLAQSGQYCRKLSEAAMDFVCEEKIRDTHFSLSNNLKIGYDVILVGKELEYPQVVRRIPHLIMDPAKTKRINYLCDYQVIRKDGALNEKRILLKENRVSFNDSTKLLEDRRIALLSPLFAPLRILLPEKQDDYFFRIRGEDTIRGRKTYILEASPKSGDEDGIWSAKIWIDKDRFIVHKCEIEGIPVEGYEDILKDCVDLNARPNFITTHEYKLEKEGILFPWRSEVRVAYQDIDPAVSIPKSDITFSYDKYRFFTVSTEHQIIK